MSQDDQSGATGRSDAPRLAELIPSIPGVIVAFSSIFLLIGITYNSGLFLPIDVKLITVLTLADHVNTSIAISFTMIALMVMIAMLALIALGLLVSSITFVAWLADRSGSKRNAPGRGESGRVQVVIEGFFNNNQHGAVITAALANGILFGITYAFIVPEQARARFETCWVILVIVGIGAAVSYAQAVIEGGRFARALTAASFTVLFFAFPFQLGIMEAGGAFAFIYDPERPGRYATSLDSKVHLIRANDSGVFVSVRSGPGEEAGDGRGSIRFDTWDVAERLRIAVP